MKRITGVFLMLLLLNSTALAAVRFNPSSASERKALGIECFRHCAFGSEYRLSTMLLSRWEEDIRIYADGSPKDQDMEALDGFIEECTSRCENMPPMYRVSSKSQANVVIYYGPLESLDEHVTDYVKGNWGYFSYWYTWRLRRNKAEIGIATDVTSQKQRNHLMKEELIGALGLSNDHNLYTDSILYAPWTETQELSDVDWMMMNMLYHKDLSCGMSAKEACRILQEVF